MHNVRRGAAPVDQVDYTKLKEDNYTNYPIRYNVFSQQASIQRKKNSDVSYEVALIERSENRIDDESNGLNKFRTGLSLAPPVGYYFQLTPSSLLLNNGYMMNTINLHPEDDREEIIVSLYKVNDGPDIDLPFPAICATLMKAYISQNLFKCNDVDSSICGDSSSRELEIDEYGSNNYHRPKTKKKPVASKKKGGSHFM